MARFPAPIRNTIFLGLCVGMALALLAGTTAFVAVILALLRGTPVSSPHNLYASLICGLIAWLFMGVFHLRKETVQLRVTDQVKFQRRMQKVLQDMGFRWVHMSDNLWRTQPAFRSLLLGEGITMLLAGNQATLTGPRLSLDLIRRRYRLASQLDKVQESLQDSKDRAPEFFLKRFDLRLRLEPDQLQEFQARVAELLSKEAEVVVDLQLLASSEQGIRETLWSEEIQPWLEEQGLYYEFHKDHPQRLSPGSAPTAVRQTSLIDTCIWS